MFEMPMLCGLRTRLKTSPRTKWLSVFSLTILLLYTFPVQAQETGETCNELNNEQTRLQCYDSIYRPFISIIAPSEPTGDWRVSTQTSPIDDSTKVFLRLNGDQGIFDRIGNRAQLTLSIACRENTTSLWIHFGGHYMAGSRDNITVTYRIDSNAAQTKSFRESNNSESLGLWNGGTSIPFIKSLFDGERIYIQATPYSENAVADFFTISGLEQAIKPLREACHW